MLKSEIATKDPHGLAMWRRRPHDFYDARGGLLLHQFYADLKPLVEELWGMDGVTLIVGHDHLNRALLASLMDIPMSAHASLPQRLSGLAVLHRSQHEASFTLRASNLHGGGDDLSAVHARATPRLIFVRHGVTTANRDRIFQGQAYDPSLDPIGISQIRSLGPLLESVHVRAVISSPLTRARETAHLLPELESVPHLVDPRLAEYHYGRWTGLSDVEVGRRFPHEVAALYDQVVDNPIEGAEGLPSLFRRVRSFLRFAWNQAGSQGAIVVVAHDVVLRAAIAMSLPLDERKFWQFPIDNGALSELALDAYGNVTLVRHNVLPGRLEDRHDDEYL